MNDKPQILLVDDDAALCRIGLVRNGHSPSSSRRAPRSAGGGHGADLGIFGWQAETRPTKTSRCK